MLKSVEERLLAQIRAARATARARVWAAGARPESITLNIDATLVSAHSEKERAAGNYKHGYGFHPLGCWLDETGEALAAILRPGNAGSNTACDHFRVLGLALAQLPAEDLDREILVRTDIGGQTHADKARFRREAGRVERRTRKGSAGVKKPELRGLLLAVGGLEEPPGAWEPAGATGRPVDGGQRAWAHPAARGRTVRARPTARTHPPQRGARRARPDRAWLVLRVLRVGRARWWRRSTRRSPRARREVARWTRRTGRAAARRGRGIRAVMVRREARVLDG